MPKYDTKQLTHAQYRALTLIVAGYDDNSAAVATGTSIRTIKRWKKSPDFQNLLAIAMSKVFDSALAELTLGGQLAANELKRIISDPDVSDRTKVTAISVLLTNAGKAKDALLEQRLQRIENLLDGTNPDENPTD